VRETGRYETGRRHGGEPGDRRIGVVWHTQGSGKSLTMVFYAGRIIREPAMGNPTVVVLTDRNDLDDQLFGTFSRCRDLLRQPPVQAENRADLRQKLSVEAGGVVFTTIQKFLPEEKGDRHPVLSERRNIVVIADEAHRSQYDFIDGFARHMRDALPNASFIGFTGTPIEQTDAKHDHHLLFRSRGGGNARDNRITVCVWHHLHGLHGGCVRAWGRAPMLVHWEIGVEAECVPLLRTRGDRYVM
jgi:type I restriction enzyme R subunit